MKSFQITRFLAFLFIASALQAQPTDNPVEARYPGEYPWSGDILWSQVVNIMDHGGVADGITPNDAAFVSARDALVGLGGGVLYIPSGDFYFADSIGLVDNVVVRGDDPAVADATDTDFRPPTRLIFPKFNFVASGGGTDPDTAFKGIGMSGDGINTGLVNLDINRASIFAGGYGSNSENVVIMGVRSNNVASEQSWTVPTPEQNAWQIHPNRFVSNISAFAYNNVMVANCRLNDMHYWVHRDDDGKDMTGAPGDLASFEIDDFDQPGYLINDGGTWKSVEAVFGTSVPGAVYTFSYTNHYGINVQGSTGEWGAPPWVQPNLFYSGAVIRDNWVYCTMRVKIDASGRGLVIKDNILKDRSGKRYFVHPNGDRKVQNAATLENRGIDWRGHDVLIEGNEVEVFRHLLGTGAYSSVDGEGILHQEVHGSTIDNVIIRDNTANAYIGIYKMPYVRNLLVEGNTLTGPAYLMIQSDTNGNDFPMYNVIVRNNESAGSILIRADYYSPGVLSANVYDNRIGGTLEIEDHAIHSGNTQLDGVTPATVDTRTGAVAIDAPAGGIFHADADPDNLGTGQPVRFTVLVETPSVTVEQVRFYRHKTLMHTDENPPYTFDWVSDGSRGLWSAEIGQPQQTGGLNLYTALLLGDAPAYSNPPTVVLTDPDPAGTYVAPAVLPLEVSISGSPAIDRVEFYEGGTFLGEDADSLPPYTFSFNAPERGLYSLTGKVWGQNGGVLVTDPVVVDVEGPPDGIPGNLEATALSDEEIYLTWNDTSTNAESFLIERRESGSGAWVVLTSVPAPGSEFLDAPLPDGVTQEYRVVASNVHGQSDPSDPVSATTFTSAVSPPDVPAGFNAQSLGDDRILLQWNESPGNPFGYRVDYRFFPLEPWQELGETAFGGRELRHDGLAAGQVVFYRILAWNNAGDSLFAFASGATLSSPVAETFSATGDPWLIPGRIEFEDYNVSTGYHDTSSGNEGSSDYRFPDPVDMGGGGTGVTIGWIDNGEWLEFSVIVDQAGLYDIDIGYASPNSTGSLSLKFDGVNIAPPVTFANTGAWGTYQVHQLGGVYLAAGHHLMRAYVENSGFNLDYVEFSLAEAVTYTNWQQAFLAGQPDSAPGGNADGDAYLNIFDLLFGMDPTTPDAPLDGPGITGNTGTVVFPVAKGLESIPWSVHYSHDLGNPSPWIPVPEVSLQVLSDEPLRKWYRANAPVGVGGAVYFRFEAGN